MCEGSREERKGEGRKEEQKWPKRGMHPFPKENRVIMYGKHIPIKK